MIIDDISFHDSRIVRVTEDPKEKFFDFLLDFPTDWEANIFEKKTLRFSEVIAYHIDEMPFLGLPTILKIINLGKSRQVFGTNRNQIETIRVKVEIQTNAGNRIIEFSECYFVE